MDYISSILDISLYLYYVYNSMGKWHQFSTGRELKAENFNYLFCLGPDHWHKLYSVASGDLQSPIDTKTKYVKKDQFVDLQWVTLETFQMQRDHQCWTFIPYEI